MKLKVWNQYLNQWENCFELRTVDGLLTAYIEDDVNECEVEAEIVFGIDVKDRNGKDIYDGDILRFPGGVAKIFYEKKYASFMREWIDGPAMNIRRPIEHLAANTKITAKIIGNVRETPQEIDVLYTKGEKNGK